MDATNPGISFETPIYELQNRLEKLKQIGRSDTEETIRQLRAEIAETTRRIYDNLTPWQMVQVARHKDRPHTLDYLSLVFDEFVELHGDKLFGDDPALLTGFAKLDQLQGHGRRAPKGTYDEGADGLLSSAAPIRRAIARRWPR